MRTCVWQLGAGVFMSASPQNYATTSHKIPCNLGGFAIVSLCPLYKYMLVTHRLRSTLSR